MSVLFTDDFEAGVVGVAPAGWTIDAGAWTVQSAPSGMTGKVARAAQNTATDQHLSRSFTRKTSDWLALRFQWRVGSNVGTGYRWADVKLYDGSTLALRFLHLDSRIALIDGTGATLSVLSSSIAINTVHTCIMFLKINGASSKAFAIVDGTLYDNSGSYFALANTVAGADTLKCSNNSPNAVGGEFQYLDDFYLASYVTPPTTVPSGTLSASGTVNGNACGSDKNARVRLSYTDSMADSMSVVARASSSGGTYTAISPTIIGSASPWEILDDRPAYGTPSISLGSTAFYKVTAANVIGTATSAAASAVSQVDVNAIETARFSLLHSLISAQSGGFYPMVFGDVDVGEAYGGQWVLSMAYAYFKSGITAYKTDAINQFNYLASTTNADGLLIWPGDTSKIYRDHHAREILFVILASRLMRLAGDTTTANAWVAQCDIWAKAGLDKLARTTITRHGWDANNVSGQTNNVAWAAGASVTAGAIRKPTTGNGRLYRARNSGTTHATTEPTWPTAIGSTVTDNGITWVCTSATGGIFAATYAATSPYAANSSPTTGGTGQDYDVNQVIEAGAAYALLLTDPNSAFYTAAAYRTSADTIVQDAVNLLLAFQISGGKVPVGDPIPPTDGRAMYDTIYGGFTLTTAAIIYNNYGASVHQDLRLLVGAICDWFDTLTGEPLALTHYSGTTHMSIAEVEFRNAGYLVMGRTNPLANVWNTAAFSRLDDRWGWYSQAGAASITSPFTITDAGQARSVLGASWAAAANFPIQAQPNSIASAETVPSPTIVIGSSPTSPQEVDPSSIASAESVSSPTLAFGVTPILVVSIVSAEAVPAPSVEVPTSPVSSPTRLDYDIRLGPLWFLWPAETVGETAGDGLETVGAALVAADRQPRPLKLKLPVRGSHLAADPTAAGKQLRRAVRALFDNARWRLEGFFFTWAEDPDLDCWLKIGRGDLAETDPGLSFGDYELDLDGVYIVGRPGTHRPGRRAVVGDRRTGLVYRDTRQRLASLDFATQPLPSSPLILPGDIVSATASAGASIGSAVLGPLRNGQRLWRSLDAIDGEIITYMPNRAVLPDRARYLDIDAAGAVRVWSLASAPEYPPNPAGYTAAGDTDPDLVLGWERVYGGLLTGEEPLAIDNGVCRLVWLGPDPSQGLALEYWSSALGHYARVGRVLHAAGVTDVRVVELTAERAVIEWRAGRYAMRAVLQRGWWGPRLESYDDRGDVARLEYAPAAGGTVSATPQSPAWVYSLNSTGSGAQPVLWATGSADEGVDTTPTVISGTAATFHRADVLVAQLSLPGGLTASELGSLSLADARAVPVLVGV